MPSGAAPATTASGLFHYFEEDTVVALIRMLQDQGPVELVFDAVSSSGLALMRRKHLKTLGRENVQMHFCVDHAQALADKVGGRATALSDEALFRRIGTQGIAFSAKAGMRISDLLRMVRTIRMVLA